MDSSLDKFKPGDRVIVWGNRWVAPAVPEITEIDHVPQDMARALQEFQRVEVTVIGFAFSDECVIEPPPEFFGWDIDAETVDRMCEHKKNIRAGMTREYFEKFIGRKGFYLRTRSVLDVASAVTVTGPDGMFCDQCHEFAPMASANMPDDKFKCYQCREDKYRMSF